MIFLPNRGRTRYWHRDFLKEGGGKPEFNDLIFEGLGMNLDFGPGVLKGDGQTGDFVYRFKKGRGKPEIFFTVFKRGGANRGFIDLFF